MDKECFNKKEVIEYLIKLNKEETALKNEDIEMWFEKKLDDDMTEKDKLKYIVENESKILSKILKGHKASMSDEFQPIRIKMKQYRKDLGLI